MLLDIVYGLLKNAINFSEMSRFTPVIVSLTSFTR